MTVGMHEVSVAGVSHIVANLRARDRQEIFALRWDDDEAALVEDVLNVAGAVWKIWSWDGEPVAINGVIPMRPGVVMANAFGTDKWRYTLRAMTRWSREFVIPTLQGSAYHRGEAYVLAENKDARRWIEALGGRIEAYLHGYGRGRENYLLYAWDLTETQETADVLSQQRQQRAEIRHRFQH